MKRGCGVGGIRHLSIWLPVERTYFSICVFLEFISLDNLLLEGGGRTVDVQGEWDLFRCSWTSFEGGQCRYHRVWVVTNQWQAQMPSLPAAGPSRSLLCSFWTIPKFPKCGNSWNSNHIVWKQINEIISNLVHDVHFWSVVKMYNW